MKLTLLSLCCVATLAAQPSQKLGIFEGHADVGQPALAGSAVFDATAGRYTVTGGGANMWAARDEFQFVWRRATGDFALTATIRFANAEPKNHRKAALIVRENLEPDAVYADTVVHGSGLTQLQFRETAGTATHSIRFPIESPVRVKLERRDGWYTFFAAAEGEQLKELGGYAMKLNDPVYVGLAVCSHDAGKTETVIFSDVSFQEIPKPARKQKQE